MATKVRTKKIKAFRAKWVGCQNGKLSYTEYRNGGTALVLNDETEDRVVLTVWIEGLAAGEVAVKDYSENEGVLAELLRLKIVKEPHRVAQAGYVNLPVCKLVGKK